MPGPGADAGGAATSVSIRTPPTPAAGHVPPPPPPLSLTGAVAVSVPGVDLDREAAAAAYFHLHVHIDRMTTALNIWELCGGGGQPEGGQAGTELPISLEEVAAAVNHSPDPDVAYQWLCDAREKRASRAATGTS